jgi:hypothetical protein
MQYILVALNAGTRLKHTSSQYTVDSFPWTRRLSPRFPEWRALPSRDGADTNARARSTWVCRQSSIGFGKGVRVVLS